MMYEKRISTKKYKSFFKKRTKQILELKSTITELKNSQEGYNSRLQQTEERISQLKRGQLELLCLKNRFG